MVIDVKVYANLAYYVKLSEAFLKGERLEVKEGTNASQLLEIMHIPPQVSVVIFVNGSYADRKKVLTDGDKIYILPPMTGG